MSSTIIFFLFIPLLSLILLTINIIFAPHNPYMEKNNAFECGFTSFIGQNRIQFSISFFIFALLFLLFDLEILLVYPYLMSAYINETYGLLILMTFLGVLTIGFIFELGKKALTIDSRQTALSNYNFIKKSLSIIRIPLSRMPHLPNKQISTIYNNQKRSFSTTNTLKVSTVFDQMLKLKRNSKIVKEHMDANLGYFGIRKTIREMSLKNIAEHEKLNFSILNDNKVTSKFHLEGIRSKARVRRTVISKRNMDRVREELSKKVPRLPKSTLDAKSSGLDRKRLYGPTRVIGDDRDRPDELSDYPEKIELPPMHTTRYTVPDYTAHIFGPDFVRNNPDVFEEDWANTIVRNAGGELATVVENNSYKLPVIEPEISDITDFPTLITILTCLPFIFGSTDSSLVESPLSMLVRGYKYIKYILKQNVKVGLIMCIIKNYHTSSIYKNSSQYNLSKLFKSNWSKCCKIIRYKYIKWKR